MSKSHEISLKDTTFWFVCKFWSWDCSVHKPELSQNLVLCHVTYISTNQNALNLNISRENLRFQAIFVPFKEQSCYTALLKSNGLQYLFALQQFYFFVLLILFILSIISMKMSCIFNYQASEKSIPMHKLNLNACYGVDLLPYLKVKQLFVWQTVIPSKSYIYSAFMDERSKIPTIKLITIISINEVRNFHWYCHICSSKTKFLVVVKAKLEPRFGSKRK